MTKEEQLFIKHVFDLANTSYRKNIPTNTDFLTLYEQDLFLSSKENLPPIYYELIGGTPFTERKMISFLPDQEMYAGYFPIRVLEIAPVQKKFAEDLSHRDYLGALMNLGIERSVLGDILINEEGIAYLFCKENIADYIMGNLSFVRHTNMVCKEYMGEIQKLQPRFEEISGSVASVRLDSVLAVVFQGSRSQLSGLIEGKKVFVNSRLVESNSYMLKQNDVVSVRGYGKFIYKDVIGTTKKGRNYVSIMKYI